MRLTRLVPVGLILLLVIGGGVLWHTGVLHRISSREHLIALLRGGGATGALLCVAVQFLQVVIAVIPGELTSLAAGYVFGPWRGFLYSAIGVTLGSAFNFWFARVVGRPALERLIGRDKLAKIDRSLAGAKSRSAMFLLFLLPGLPKDFLCYARSEEHTSELQSQSNLVCRLLLEKKKKTHSGVPSSPTIPSPSGILYPTAREGIDANMRDFAQQRSATTPRRYEPSTTHPSPRATS